MSHDHLRDLADFAHHYAGGLNPDRLTWDAYWALCRVIPNDKPSLETEARTMARDALFAEHVRKAVGITNG